MPSTLPGLDAQSDDFQGDNPPLITRDDATVPWLGETAAVDIALLQRIADQAGRQSHDFDVCCGIDATGCQPVFQLVVTA